MTADEQAAIDRRFMSLALAEAQAAAAAGEIPIGAVITLGDRVIGRGHNMTEALTDVTAHAEMIAITSAASTAGSKFLNQATMYVTVEPCTMCAGAIGWARLGRLVIGAPEPRIGYSTVVARSPFHPRTLVTTGVMAEESATLMKEFFKSRR